MRSCSPSSLMSRRAAKLYRHIGRTGSSTPRASSASSWLGVAESSLFAATARWLNPVRNERVIDVWLAAPLARASPSVPAAS